MIIEQNINEEKWDNLIILDACRFDFFNKVYKDYLDGKLEKRISKGSNTGEWLVKTFPDKYDYTYISANPFINSYGIPIKKCDPSLNYSWNAIEHFSKIRDVWDSGFNEQFNTIHPMEVNISCLSNEYNNKTIIHYIQPHYPYLSYRIRYSSFRKEFFKFLLDNIFQSSVRMITWRLILKLSSLNFKLSREERVFLEVGLDKFYYYYEDNLRIVLKHVSQLIEELNGITIITADHGESFGEQGIWGHPPKTHIPVLIEVPWLKIINTKPII